MSTSAIEAVPAPARAPAQAGLRPGGSGLPGVPQGRRAPRLRAREPRPDSVHRRRRSPPRHPRRLLAVRLLRLRRSYRRRRACRRRGGTSSTSSTAFRPGRAPRWTRKAGPPSPTPARPRPSSGPKPLADPFGGTDLANGRHPVKMMEPVPAPDAPKEVVYLILGSLHSRRRASGSTATPSSSRSRQR